MIESPRGKTQRGFSGMAATLMALLAATVAGTVFMTSSARLAQSESAARGLDVEGAAKAAQEWGRLRAEKGECLPLAIFYGENSLPGFAGIRAETTCAAEGPEEGPKSFLVETIACTAAECPAASPFPPQYAERRISARYGQARKGGAMSKAALLDWARYLGAVRLWDFEETGRVSMDTESRTAAPSVVLDIRADQPEGTALVDSSPFPKSVTAEGSVGVMRSTFAMGGGSIEFNAGSDRVLVGPSDDLLIPEGADFTLSMWAYPRTFPGTASVIQYLLHSGNPNGLWVRVVTNQLRVGVGATTLMTTPSTTGVNTLRDDSWSQIMITRQDGQIRTFINGTMNVPVEYAGEIDLSGGFAIGRGQGGEGVGYDGLIDDVKLVVGKAERVFSYSPPVQDVPNDLWLWEYSCQMQYPGLPPMRDLSAWKNPVANPRTQNYVQGAKWTYGHCYEHVNGESEWHEIGGKASTPFGADDFSIDLHISSLSGSWATSALTFLAGDWGSGLGGWKIEKNATKVAFVASDGAAETRSAETTLAAGDVFHVAREGASIRIFKNGVLSQTLSFSGSIPAPTGKVWLGVDPSGTIPAAAGRSIFNIKAMKGKPVWKRTGRVSTGNSVKGLDSRHVAANAAELIMDFESGISDASPKPATIRNLGVARTDAAAIGQKAALFAGGARLEIENDGRFVFGSKPHKLSLLVRFDATAMGKESCILDLGADLRVCKATDDKPMLGATKGGRPFVPERWYLVELYRTSSTRSSSGLSISLAVDGGTAIASVTAAHAGTGASFASIGSKNDGSSPFYGVIDQIRLATANLSDEAFSELPVYASPHDALLLTMDKLDVQSDYFDDSSYYRWDYGSNCSLTSNCANHGADAAFGKTGQWSGVRTTLSNSATNYTYKAYSKSDLDHGVEFWFRPDAIPEAGMRTEVVAIGAPSTAGDALTIAHPFQMTENGGFSFRAAGGVLLSCPSGTISANRWHHAAMSFINGKRRLFVDGRPCTDWVASGAANSSSSLSIGRETVTSVGGVQPFAGRFDEIRVRYGSAIHVDAFHPRKPKAWNEETKRSLLLEKAAGSHAEVTAGTAIAWKDPHGVGAAELTSATTISAPPIRGDETADGATVVVLANPASASVFGATENAALFRAGGARSGARDMLALMRSGTSREFTFGTGSGAGEWDGAESIGGSMGPADVWGIYAGSATADGAGIVSKNGKTVGEGTGHSISTVARPFVSIGGDLAGGSRFEGDLGAISVFGRRLTPGELALLQEAWDTGRLPDELAFRSDDATLTDRIGSELSSSGVTADPDGDSAGAAWVLSGAAGQGVSSDSGRTVGTGDFSIEAFVRIDRTPADSEIVSIGGLSLRVGGGGRLRAVFGGQEVAVGPTIALGQWQRLSLRRKGGMLEVRAGRSAGTAIEFAESLQGTVSVAGASGRRTLVGRMRDVAVWIGKAPD